LEKFNNAQKQFAASEGNTKRASKVTATKSKNKFEAFLIEEDDDDDEEDDDEES
jgi:hypothetical protein